MQPPYITTRQMLANQAAIRWQAQYSKPEYRHHVHMSTLVELVALGQNPTPQQVDAVIGNGSWTRLTCDQCGKDVDMVITVGAEPDYESHTASLCLECVEKVHSMALTIGK